MKDQRLRKAFVYLCEHLNVKKKWYGGFDHEFEPESSCKVARKADIERLQKELEGLQESVQELRKKRK